MNSKVFTSLFLGVQLFVAAPAEAMKPAEVSDKARSGGDVPGLIGRPQNFLMTLVEQMALHLYLDLAQNILADAVEGLAEVRDWMDEPTFSEISTQDLPRTIRQLHYIEGNPHCAGRSKWSQITFATEHRLDRSPVTGRQVPIAVCYDPFRALSHIRVTEFSADSALHLAALLYHEILHAHGIDDEDQNGHYLDSSRFLVFLRNVYLPIIHKWSPDQLGQSLKVGLLRNHLGDCGHPGPNQNQAGCPNLDSQDFKKLKFESTLLRDLFSPRTRATK